MKKTMRHSSGKSEAREYCFVISSYKRRYNRVGLGLCRLIEQRIGLRCIRADYEPEPGRDLLAKVHEMILGASAVVADVSEYSPNVYYEYGYASAHDRLPVLIARQGRKLPTDLVGKETLRYRNLPESDTQFIDKFLHCVERALRSPLPEQRRMLSSASAFPAYIIAAPRVPEPGSKHWWHPIERTTFGDNVGVAGILSAYGNLFGTRRLPNLLHAKYLSKTVLKKPATFFCIGSSKVNDATEHFLPRVQKGLQPQWKMPQLGRGSDRRVVFQGDSLIDAQLRAPVKKTRAGSLSDYGLVVRATHPQDPEHLVLIVAGRHSIGTHAACMVAIRRELIEALDGRLKDVGVSLRDTSQPFWAIVRGTLMRNGQMSEDVEIIKVGGYTRSGATRRRRG